MNPPRTGINAFCGRPDSEGRTWMHKPWVKGDHVYATNGHMLVECPIFSRPVLEAIGVVEKPDQIPNNVADMLAAAFAEPSWQALPRLPAFRPCFGCGGTGVTCDDDGNISSIAKDGGTCGWCEGYGEEFFSIVVGDTQFCIRYMRLLSSLPGVMISPNGRNACAFKFDGGRGLMMPRIA